MTLESSFAGSWGRVQGGFLTSTPMLPENWGASMKERLWEGRAAPQACSEQGFLIYGTRRHPPGLCYSCLTGDKAGFVTCVIKQL